VSDDREQQRLPVTCVVPAAGLSTRFGGPKLLAELDGRPLIEHSVRNAADACAAVVVVVGSGEGRIRPAIPELDGVGIVTNTRFADGMLTSIRCGARHVATDRFFVAPGDMPFLRPLYYAAVWRAAERQSRSDAWYPFRDARRGHPVLIRTSIIADLERTRARSMREFLQAYHTSRVHLESEWPFVDLDTPEDLSRYQEYRRELREFTPAGDNG
jgi:molybdenum cofactor cytidylyltransferase